MSAAGESGLRIVIATCAGGVSGIAELEAKIDVLQRALGAATTD